MAYIPSDAKWYVAELIIEIEVAEEPANAVHKNLVLIRADSPDDAYEKAQLLGKAAENSYENPLGRLVQMTFRGLGELVVVHDDLEHGAELLYEESVGVPREQIDGWVLPKERLSVFRPVSADGHPDYSSREVLDDAERLLRPSTRR